ncbi:hypothetical protein AAHC03_024350 [Spirometra sp. Aus1]
MIIVCLSGACEKLRWAEEPISSVLRSCEYTNQHSPIMGAGRILQPAGFMIDSRPDIHAPITPRDALLPPPLITDASSSPDRPPQVYQTLRLQAAA